MSDFETFMLCMFAALVIGASVMYCFLIYDILRKKVIIMNCILFGYEAVPYDFEKDGRRFTGVTNYIYIGQPQDAKSKGFRAVKIKVADNEQFARITAQDYTNPKAVEISYVRVGNGRPPVLTGIKF